MDNRCSERQTISENPAIPSDHISINETSMEAEYVGYFLTDVECAEQEFLLLCGVDTKQC